MTDRVRHGMRNTPEYRVWIGMKQRCTNPKKRDYKWYGAKGIAVCAEWMQSFMAFYTYVGPRPSDQHTIDRIKVELGYQPGNVRWATNQEQKDNTTVVRMVTIGGKTQSISAWEREKGLAKGQVRSREATGWSLEEAITTPSIKGQKRHMTVERDYSTRSRDEHGRYRQEAT